jgi:dihydropteroate synthase
MVKQSKYLFAPPCSEEIETYIIPIPKHQYEVYEGLKIAGGWRYFDNLRVIQKKKDTFIEVLMSVSDFIKLARSDSKESLRKAEMSIENIVKKRPSFANIDMSLPHIMGVSNLTPDSFYKNSRNSNPDIVLRKCKEMLKNGATIIDIGGESSRPGADKISENEEQQRILQTLLRLKQENVKTIISLDTRNLSTMKLGQKTGIDIINDISSLDSIEKANFIISKKLPVIIMHMQNNPENMQDNPKYSFSPIDIYNFFEKKIFELLQLGIDISNLVIDPGIGFGKNKFHNLDILKNLSIFHSLGVPILIGVSRKALIGQLTIEDFKFRDVYKKSINPSKRLSGSIAFAMHAFNNGIQIIRTHDVFETKQALTCQFSLN